MLVAGREGAGEGEAGGAAVERRARALEVLAGGGQVGEGGVEVAAGEAELAAAEQREAERALGLVGLAGDRGGAVVVGLGLGEVAEVLCPPAGPRAA